MKSLEDVIDGFLNDHIGKPLYSFIIKLDEVFIQAGEMSKEEWIEMGEELIELLASYNYKYEVNSACRKHVTLGLTS